MTGVASRRAWLLMAAGENRGHGGNSGYDDQFDAYYSWDSNVPNARQLKAGDPVALWDKDVLLGVSVIESIESWPGTKLLNRCRSCGTTRISLRKRRLPRYRCMRCLAEFDEPVRATQEVDLFRARYDAAWVSLEGLVGESEVRKLALHAGDFNAMRPIRWESLLELLVAKHADRAARQLMVRSDLHWPPDGINVEIGRGGFTPTLVRVRRGQRQFREHLMATQGLSCAFTGSAPERALEAGHLYSYAELGSHFRHGGLMLRRDIHALFDDGQLAVDPGSLRVDVSSRLAEHPQYARLHDQPLSFTVNRDQVNWLAIHWEEHRLQQSA